MSDRPTPETDALISVGLENADQECVPAEFARKLERERDEARVDAAALADKLSGLELRSTDELARLEQERNEARSEQENSRQSLAFALEELNEARAVADELSAIAARYLGWHLSRTPMGPDDDHLAQARRITETLARWKALASA